MKLQVDFYYDTGLSPEAVSTLLRSVGLRPFACWDCGFESRKGHGCLSLVIVVCYHVEVSATGRSHAQRSHTACVCISMSVIRCNNKSLYLRLERCHDHESKKASQPNLLYSTSTLVSLLSEICAQCSVKLFYVLTRCSALYECCSGIF